MIIQGQKDLKALLHIGSIVADCLQMMLSHVEPGISTAELDQMGGEFLKSRGAVSAPRLMYEFPGETCISINQEAAHGIPSKDRVLKEGDVVNIDVSAMKDHYFADTGGSKVIAPASNELKALCKACKRSLNRAIDAVKAGEKLNVIGKAIEKEAKKSGFKIIKNLCSHGVGRKLHEEPELIPGFFKADETRRLKENMVITIEPFLSTGTELVSDGKDGWALLNQVGSYSAQYEHSMVITKKKPIILTRPSSER
ncbi:MAG: type I methionyl aminopeptidase [Oligoflexales bacterium]|nr:type I methionyl aminopeptidase [Oligoflexales bacterium]